MSRNAHHVTYSNRTEAEANAPTLDEARALYPTLDIVAVTVEPAGVISHPEWHNVNIWARTFSVQVERYGIWTTYHAYRSIENAKYHARRVAETFTTRIRATRRSAPAALGMRA